MVVRRLTDEASSESDQRPPDEGEKERGGLLGFFRELPGLILVAFVLALLIKTFLVQAFFIPSESMVPTLLVGDRVLVNKLVYDFGKPQRWDVIVFEDPHEVDEDRGFFPAIWDWLTEGLGFATAPHQDFIKRVVGLPGEEVRLDGGHLLIDDQRLVEPDAVELDFADFPEEGVEPDHVKVKPDHVFVMGDNRGNSSDSRGGLGQIPYDKIVGKAFVLLWPPSRIEWLSDD